MLRRFIVLIHRFTLNTLCSVLSSIPLSALSSIPLSALSSITLSALSSIPLSALSSLFLHYLLSHFLHYLLSHFLHYLLSHFLHYLLSLSPSSFFHLLVLFVYFFPCILIRLSYFLHFVSIPSTFLASCNTTAVALCVFTRTILQGRRSCLSVFHVESCLATVNICRRNLKIENFQVNLHINKT
jgi:hypothetical protein